MSLLLSDLALFIQNNEKSVDDKPHAELEGQDLWKEFSVKGTEMVITKKGRRMFPMIRTKLYGLDWKSKYIMMLEMVQYDCFRYKFTNGKWEVSGKGDIQPIRAPVMHPGSPKTGEDWMKDGACFKMLKLSNDPMNADGHIFLNSMHRYVPRFHIVRCDCFGNPIFSTFKSFVFDHTDFIAVTAYQNIEVTAKKIANNPFAKGFRKPNLEEKQRRNSRVLKKQETVESSSEDMDQPSILPNISNELMAQWQLALFSSYGSIQPEPLNLKIPDIPKKSGFGVLDLLAEPNL
ncbi:Protein CBR-TBX-7 [Caenorhabditis briggsae]|uniref:Protein CBR-TBX-7 n=2 Tax=Caenorhabditis briggsae TaxID=6238 RepID=A8X803_CAEBR|nr:Protein CBR-TBX-7 [Caenorhabditis briggsae]ULT99591.1 hypothetical protein L3Y34_000704 [Caenorhabditis briggsae]CAP28764.2 Protein CBR-TBX-7 [Caenorhabditis briggsae]